MNIDFKITIWERIGIPEELEEEILAKFKSGEFEDYHQMTDAYPEEEFPSVILYGSEEAMTLDDNKGNSTFEIMSDGKTLYSNG
ncbi:MAG: hypothetical protein U9O94_07015 [Nanoarchaeota archaeon]|nr:hypothetical protein [Nanoarchaeota archaeon]